MSEVTVRSRILTAEGEMRLIDDAAAAPRVPEYVEGAIELVVDGTEVLGLRHWDDVDSLWGYIANALGDLLTSGHGSTLFPDQPIELTFTRERSEVVVALRVPGEPPVVARASESSFVGALCAGGIHFCERLMQLVPADQVSFARMRADFVQLAVGRVPRQNSDELVVDEVLRRPSHPNPVVVALPPRAVVRPGTRLARTSGTEAVVVGVDLETLRTLDDGRIALVVAPEDEDGLVPGSSWSVLPPDDVGGEDWLNVEL